MTQTVNQGSDLDGFTTESVCVFIGEKETTLAARITVEYWPEFLTNLQVEETLEKFSMHLAKTLASNLNAIQEV